MKRMSEVLNIRVVKNACYDASNDSWICAFVDEEKAQHAAHAISNADALADALESVVEMAWLISDDLADEFSTRPEIVAAQKALAAYRGGK